MPNNFANSYQFKFLLRCFISVFFVLLLSAPAAASSRLYIHAAASTANAIQAIVEAYRPAAEAAGHAVEPIVNLAASSTLARHIEAGAPADFFLSANQVWMDYLKDKNRIDPTAYGPLLRNRLVMISPHSRQFEPADQLDRDRLTAWLGNERLVLGDPQHVPAGIYGQEALMHLGLWPVLQGRLAYAKSVRDALNFVILNEVPLGIVYETDAAFSDKVAVVHRFAETSHTPIIYSAGIPTEASHIETARHFYTYIRSAPARRIFAEFGFGTVDIAD